MESSLIREHPFNLRVFSESKYFFFLTKTTFFKAQSPINRIFFSAHFRHKLFYNQICRHKFFSPKKPWKAYWDVKKIDIYKFLTKNLLQEVV